MIDLLKTVFGTLAVLGGAGGAGTVVYKRRPSKSTSLAEELEVVRNRVTDTEKVATDAKAEAAGAKSEAAASRQEMRVLTDYVHDLREHIAMGYPPPPPDWPKGLRL